MLPAISPAVILHLAMPNSGVRRCAAALQSLVSAGAVIAWREVRNRWFADSALEGTGFEPSGPRGKGPTLRMSVLLRSDFSVGGEPTRGDIERLVVSRGTDCSNPVPSSAESSTNRRPVLSQHACRWDSDVTLPLRLHKPASPFTA